MTPPFGLDPVLVAGRGLPDVLVSLAAGLLVGAVLEGLRVIRRKFPRNP